MKMRPDGTKARIRTAALHEFSAHGFAGARVQRIAASAKVNIRMIYYFFGSKRKLLEAVVGDIFRHRKAHLAADFANGGDLLTTYFDGYAEDSERVRLLQWEALQTKLPGGAKTLTDFKGRQEVTRYRIASIIDLQRRKVLPGDLDPQLLYLAFVALSIYPMAFPQSVLIATGKNSADKKFQRRYRAFLKQLSEALGTDRTSRRRVASPIGQR
jgi:TetR/AcrR family transcriptional regulator